MRTVSIIGVGRLGGALAIALSRSGYSVRHLIQRSGSIDPIASAIEPRPAVITSAGPADLDSDIIFITTGDRQIGPTADVIAASLGGSSVVLHASGALSSDVLVSASRRGNPTGSLHPLVSVSDPLTGSGSFRDAYFCVEGNTTAVDVAEEIVKALGGRSFKIESDLKPLYHASAVMASGHVTALFALATEVLARCGPSGDEAANALRPLVHSTIRNLSVQTAQKALTGPFARADMDTVKLHLMAFKSAGMTAALATYLELGLKSMELAEKAGADPREIELLREYIKLAKGSDR